MARNQDLILLATSSDAFVELTNADADAVLLQVQYGEVILRATVDATRPPDDAGGVIMPQGSGEWQLDLDTFFHLPGAKRLWAQRRGASEAIVLIGHIDAQP